MKTDPHGLSRALSKTSESLAAAVQATDEPLEALLALLHSRREFTEVDHVLINDVALVVIAQHLGYENGQPLKYQPSEDEGFFRYEKATE